MIRFSCRCGYVFEAPEDAAGIELQCPECHLLNDVPFLTDLAAIAGDGTYGLDEHPQEQAPEIRDDMLRIYGTTTADGKPIDLRNLPDKTEDIGEYETCDQARKRSRPRYDPETGELVKPIPLAQSCQTPERVDPSTIPFARPTISYAANGAIVGKTGTLALLELAQPVNLLAMGFVFALHMLVAMTGIAMDLSMILIAPITLGLLLLIVAHYGNVVEELGPGDSNELPRVMRDMRWSEDFWHPLSSIALTTMICYGPAIVFACKSPLPAPATAAIAAAMALAGTFFVPAILLTLLTSGSLANLRPDRVMGVIGLSAGRYFALVIAFAVAAVPYFWAVAALTIEAYIAYGNVNFGIPAWMTMWPLALPLMCFGIFAMHFFCWQLAMLYRLHHADFPWVDRFQVRERRPPVERRKPRYVSAPTAAEDHGGPMV